MDGKETSPDRPVIRRDEIRSAIIRATKALEQLILAIQQSRRQQARRD